jgi:protoheme IX farnesyltransferase
MDPVRAARRRLGDYLDLSKARLNALVLATAAVGFVVAEDGPIGWSRLLATLIGTALAGLGANALNQFLERQRDGRMERTRGRPLPARRLTEREALTWGLTVALAGPVWLAMTVNLLTAGLAVLTQTLYLGVYTPLKTRSSLCTLVGAVCGALPPVMGWTGATGRIEPGALLLGATLFAWQIPHFMALAWLYREDYERGGFRMLPRLDPAGGITCLVVVLYSLVLIGLGPMLTLTGVAGWIYAGGSLVVGMGLLVMGLRLYRSRTRANARRVFLASLVYLPVVLGLMTVDRNPVFIRTVPLASVQADTSGTESSLES